MVIERSFTSIESAATSLAEELAACLETAIVRRGCALLAVSGGRTPQYVFSRLRKLNVDWNRVTVTLTDERWVPTDNPNSNAALVQKFLLQGAAAAARFVPMYGGEESPQEGQVACEARLKALLLPFDAVYLGMGEDGHFASLFPNDSAVQVREGICVAVREMPSRMARMSLTLPAILEARNLFILISGYKKLQRYKQAKLPGSSRELPLRQLLTEDHSSLIVLRVHKNCSEKTHMENLS